MVEISGKMEERLGVLLVVAVIAVGVVLVAYGYSAYPESYHIAKSAPGLPFVKGLGAGLHFAGVAAVIAIGVVLTLGGSAILILTLISRSKQGHHKP